MMITRINRIVRRLLPSKAPEGGVAAVELAILLPLMLALCFVLIESCRLFNAQILVDSAATDAVRYLENEAKDIESGISSGLQGNQNVEAEVRDYLVGNYKGRLDISDCDITITKSESTLYSSTLGKTPSGDTGAAYDDDQYSYYLYTGDANGDSKVSSDEYSSRKSTYKSANVSVKVVYHGEFILPVLDILAAASGAEAAGNNTDWTVSSEKTGSMYLGGSEW